MKNLSEGYLSAVKRILPVKAVKPTVGLDIGASSCRMVEVIKRADGCELLRWSVEPIVNGDVAKAIRAVMSKVSLPNLSPTTALTGKGTLIRFVEMPKMSLEDLKRSFSFEVDKYFPFPKDQIFTDCHILNEDGKDNKLPVLVAAAKKELVNDRIKLLVAAGLQADAISLNSIAVANVVDVLGAPKDPATEAAKGDRTMAVLDVGETVSNLTVFLNDSPKFNRDIFIGGRDFTKALSAALKVSFDEAEKIKRDPAARAAEIAPVLESMTLDLVSELRLSLDYFVTETNLSLNKLYLTGGSSTMSGMTDNLSKHLEMSVQHWEPFNQLKLGTGITAEQIGPHKPFLSVALGLALT